MRSGVPLREEEAEDALHIANAVVDVFVTFDGGVEEAGRRQLLAVADDDGLLASRDRAEGVDGFHLTRLVEHDQVELDGVRWQILRDRHRAHHEDGFDRLNAASCLLDQLANRKVPTLLVDLPLDDSELASPA